MWFCFKNSWFYKCVPLQDDDKPMIEIMDQLSPAVMNSFVHVAVSDSVSVFPLRINKISAYSLLLRLSFKWLCVCIMHKFPPVPSLSPHCLSATMLTCSGWWSGQLDWWAVPMTWRAQVMSGSLPSAWKIPGGSVFTSSCGKRTYRNTAPSPWDTPGLTFSRGCNCCYPWLTPSMRKHTDYFVLLKSLT